jgi:uncharacterized protein (DUF1330 family)
MAAYFLVDVTTTDPALMAEYRTHTPGLVGKYGGRFVIRGGASETVEGDWKPERVVMLEFPDRAAFRRFYDSEDYKPVLKMRMAAGRSRAVLAEGVDGQKAPPAAPAGAPGSGYIIVDSAASDEEKLGEYRDKVSALMAEYGGRRLVRTGAVEPVEGGWRPEQLTIVVFPTMAALRAFTRSDAYKPLRAMRLAATRSNTLVVEGV